MNTDLNERIRLFDDAVHMKNHGRIPMISDDYTWKIYDSDKGYTLEEAIYDWDKMYEVQCEFHERYEFDAYIEMGGRDPWKVTESLDGNLYYLSEAGINHKDECCMEDDEFQEFIDDPMKFMWSKAMPRKLKAMNSPDAFDRFDTTLKEFNAMNEYNARVGTKFNKEYGVPGMNQGFPKSGLEWFFNHVRGIRKTALDLRRRPELLLEACYKWEEAFEDETFYAAAKAKGPKPSSPDDVPHFAPTADGELVEQGIKTTVADFQSAILAHTILTPKQFEKFYWYWWKKIFDACEENGKCLYAFIEGSIDRFADFFQDVKPGMMYIHSEMDDPIELHKLIPNCCIVGGMKAALLGRGTVDENIAYAKECIDAIAPDGGFILSQNKMQSFKNDSTRENLLATVNFVRDYKG